MNAAAHDYAHNYFAADAKICSAALGEIATLQKIRILKRRFNNVSPGDILLVGMFAVFDTDRKEARIKGRADA